MSCVVVYNTTSVEFKIRYDHAGRFPRILDQEAGAEVVLQKGGQY